MRSVFLSALFIHLIRAAIHDTCDIVVYIYIFIQKLFSKLLKILCLALGVTYAFFHARSKCDLSSTHRIHLNS